ncbi:sirohydrochlorin ferrochelatase [Homoserinimonas aerilata]|uniref:Sirohydrochlorin ferrochelatase n=1 Tax=Homoserinimonas aerilata TaxID=1162970 RepID=A0A542YHM9_9MICO|nr:CbiX/SirB N-terminal domain-containing protein [Homoserinimonas aerilata]TQL47607.1 sirohydrochlorin ferrochelatase [Homoserinimonas aerilata]
MIPALAAISHGTSSPQGQAAVAALVEAVAGQRPGLSVRGGFVDVQRPDVAETLARFASGEQVVVVPLLLSAGYHVNVDLVRELDAAATATVLADALGPDRRIAGVLSDRLAGAGLRRPDRVVLACAGSTDAAAVDDCFEAARMLSAELGMPVRAGFISAARPTLAEAIAMERAVAPGSRVVVSSYLLAPGHFADLAAAAPADVVTGPLLLAGEHPPAALVRVVLDRHAAAAALLERVLVAR